MIRKTRIKIIGVTMTIITIFLCVLAAIIIVTNYNLNEEAVAALLVKKVDALRDNGSYSEDDFDQLRSFTMTCVEGDEDILLATYRSEVFTDEDMTSYWHYVKTMDVDQYTYRRVDFNQIEMMVYNDGGIYHLAGVDRTLENNMFADMTMTVIVVTICGFFVLFLIIWALSYWMVRPVKEALDQQRKFISDASHELKTPLTIINANIAVLKSENAGNNWVENIQDQTTRMNALIGDMLSLARLDESHSVMQEKPVRFNLSQAIVNSVLSFEAIAFEQRKHFDVAIQPDVEYFGVEQDVSKLCNLLVDNAVKYCNDGGQIEVKFHDANKPVLTVRNTGCLIDYADRFRIFERFYRGDDSRNRKTGGSGLGLAIVKALAEKYRWKINVDCHMHGDMVISIAF